MGDGDGDSSWHRQPTTHRAPAISNKHKQTQTQTQTQAHFFSFCCFVKCVRHVFFGKALFAVGFTPLTEKRLKKTIKKTRGT
jgi:hypothetical protein